MCPITTLGNESHVVAISTYCHDSALIATNTTVAIDAISCSVACREYVGTCMVPVTHVLAAVRGGSELS
jgi:hypothetical protein